MKRGNITCQVLAIALFALSISACHKKKKDEVVAPADITQEVLTDFSSNVANATYKDLESKAILLDNAVVALNANTNDANLNSAKQLWKDTRAAWEQSEAFLFGPVATQNYDPGIDTWPVNQTDLDAVLADNIAISPSYIDSLPESLKGFHPLEYMLFGATGNKVAADFTLREKQYMLGLADYVKRVTVKIREGWDPAVGNYTVQFNTAGVGSTYYQTKRAAFEEVINAMVGICDEVANGKIQEPLLAQDPKLEESYFSKNSLTDFTNNMISVKNVYYGKYSTQGKSLHDYISQNNLALDNKITSAINTSISSFANVTVPFGEAIVTQQMQVVQLQNSINALKDVLDGDLLPFVQSSIQ